MLQLYPDQIELVQNVRAAMRTSKSVLMVSPTGSGKTAVATHMIQAAQNKNSRMIFTVPRKDLLEQTSESFKAQGIPHSFIAAGKPYNPFSQVYIGMVDSMARRINKLPDVKLLIPDETHFGAGSLNSVINHYKSKGAYILGLSATPHKTSGKGLGCWYDTMVEGKSVAWLIENKRLSNYRYFYGRTKVDLSKIKITAGEYNKHDVADYMEHQGVIIGDAVKDYRGRCMGRIHIVRCASVKHSEMTAEAFRNAGIPAVHVDGETLMPERKRIFRALAMRELLVICFCDLLGMGFDLSMAAGMDVCVESASDLKPSKSLSSQMQFWGRALRYKPEPAVFNDHVNNYVDHGTPKDAREWTLADREKQPRESGERVSPIRQCMGGHKDGPSLGAPMIPCYFVHSPAPRCPNCGAWYEIQSRIIEEMDGELIELDEGMGYKKIEQGTAKSLDALVALGRQRGMKHPEAWASHVWTARRNKAMQKVRGE